MFVILTLVNVSVIAHPNSKNPRIENDLFGNLHVYVAEPPLEGKANRAILIALAKYFNVKNYQVDLTSGAKSKNKVFSINK